MIYREPGKPSVPPSEELRLLDEWTKSGGRHAIVVAKQLATVTCAGGMLCQLPVRDEEQVIAAVRAAEVSAQTLLLVHFDQWTTEQIQLLARVVRDAKIRVLAFVPLDEIIVYESTTALDVERVTRVWITTRNHAKLLDAAVISTIHGGILRPGTF